LKKTSAKSKQYYEDRGYIVASVEHWNSFVGNMIPDKKLKCGNCNANIMTWKHAGIRMDLFNFADLIAFASNSEEVILIQSSAGTRHADHLRTIMNNDKAEAWVQFTNRKIHLISWSERVQKDENGKTVKFKTGKRAGESKKTLQPRVEEITRDMFGEEEPF
jgi:hypothetical protein